MFYIGPQLEGSGRNSLEKNFKTREPPYTWLKIFLAEAVETPEKKECNRKCKGQMWDKGFEDFVHPCSSLMHSLSIAIILIISLLRWKIKGALFHWRVFYLAFWLFWGSSFPDQSLGVKLTTGKTVYCNFIILKINFMKFVKTF